MSPQMKTVHCIYSFTMGGAETMLTDIVNRQSAGGDDVTLLVVNDVVDESMPVSYTHLTLPTKLEV